MTAALFALLVVVLHLPGQPADDGLVAALRIQLAGRAEVEAGGELGGATLAERIAGARAAAKARGAALAVWVERSGAQVVLVVVGEAEGRAVVQILEVPAGVPADTERALALKVGSVLDALLAPEAVGALAPGAPREAPEARSPWRPVVSVALEAESSPGDHRVTGGLALRAGAGRGAWELGGSVSLGLGDRWAAAAGTVDTDELGARLDVRRTLGRGWWAGGGAGVRVVAAAARDGAGRSDAETVVLPLLEVQGEKRWKLQGFPVALGVQASLATRRQRFTVTGAEVADLGRVRLGLTLALSWP